MFSTTHNASFWLTSNKKAVNDEHFKYPRDFHLNSHFPDPGNSRQFFTVCKMLFYSMAACGRFPFHRDSSGCVKFSRLSLPWLYWVMVYAFMATVSAGLFIESYQKIWREKSFDVAVFSARVCVVLVAVFLMPISNWSEWRLMAEYINRMDAFLVKFERLTGKQLQMKSMKYMAMANVLYTPVLSFAGTYIERESLAIKHFDQQLLYVVLYCGGNYFCTFVICGQWTMWKVADYLHAELSKVAAKSRRKIHVPATHIHKLKCLWVKGTELLIENGKAAGCTILIWMLVNSGLAILGMYGFLRCVLAYDFTSATPHAVNAFTNLAWLVVLCEIGFTSTTKMGNRIVSPLSTIETTGLSELATMEVTIFLHIVSLHPPVISCGGLITLGRTFIVSVFSNTLTYLIVLVQFKKAESQLSEDLDDTTSSGTEVTDLPLNWKLH